MPRIRLSRRDFCVAGGASLVVAGCGSTPKSSHSDGGAVDMNVATPTDFSGLYRPPDFACSTQPAGGPFTAFAVGTATYFRCARLFICRDSAGIYALTAICTHERCNVTFDQMASDFTCPCHLSTFDFNGAVTHSPATRPLVHFKVSLDGSGNVVVDPTVVVDPATRLAVPGD